MNTIQCTHCGRDVELSEALTKDIEKTVLEAEHQKHVAEQANLKTELSEMFSKQLEEERLKAQESATAKTSLKLKQLEEENAEDKKENKELRDQLTALVQELRESKKAMANAELEMQKRVAEEEAKIREDATKVAEEKQRLNLAAKDKQLQDAMKVNEELQRKLQQGSQQMQGEIMELNFENALADAFRDDDIEPVAKGIKGGDIKHTVKSPRGTVCGVMLWELKRTKNWVDGWIPKLKEDLRNEKANIPIIITEVMPKAIADDIGQLNGVWICKPASAIILGTLLRKSLLDVGRQKAVTENRESNAEALYNFVTSHEFVQQIEAMVETYTEMITDITKEKAAFDRIWAKRENQAKKLLGSTANIVGSMQGQLGTGAMPRIKGLDLLDPGE